MLATVFYSPSVYASMKQTLSGYISMIVPVNNEKRSNNEVLQVPVGVGTFTSTSSFDTQSLQFATMNTLKRSMPGGL